MSKSALIDPSKQARNSNQAKKHANDYLCEYQNNPKTPNWLKLLIQEAINTNGNVSTEKKDGIFTELLKENNLESLVTTNSDLKNEPSIVDISQSSSEISRLVLKDIQHIKGINALLSNQAITFSPNCTLIFGLNGSGKSGYFRIIHELAGGDKRKNIVNDIYKPDEGLEVNINFFLNGQEQNSYKWEDLSKRGVIPFRQIKVFDSEYLPIFLNERENTVNIEPLGLNLFQEISSIIDELKKRLEDLKQQKITQRPDLEPLIESIHSTEIKSLLTKDTLNDTDIKLLEDSKKFSNDESTRLVKAKQKKSALEKNNQEDSKKVLAQEKNEIDQLKDHLSQLKTNLEKLTSDISLVINDYMGKKESKDNALQQFEILKNLPSQHSDTWHTFIESAENYSAQINKEDFDKEKQCIYCHQSLNDAALELTKAYTEYLKDQTQEEFKVVTGTMNQLEGKLGMVTTAFTFPENLGNCLNKIENDKKQSYKILADQILIEAQEQVEKLTIAMTNKTSIADIFSLDLMLVDKKLIELSEEKQKAINDLSASDIEKVKMLSDLQTEINQLEDKQNISQWKVKIENHFSINKIIKSCSEVNQEINTRNITTMSSKAHEELLTESIKLAFEDELKALGKNDIKVNLEKTSAGKGSIKTRLQVSGNNVCDILSEGEQKAVGLALFLAEIRSQNEKNPIVFDDPVNSLDHKVRDNFAKRLAELSKQQQVIVFTHELLFANQIIKHNDESSSDSLFAHIIDSSMVGIGRINLNTVPKMSNLKVLKTKYNDAITDIQLLDFAEQERRLASAFDYLRCSCECLIEELLFGKTIRRYDDHIKVQNLEEAVLDKELASEIVSLHGEISEKAMMHNRSDFQGQEGISLNDFNALKSKFEALETNLSSKRKERTKKREEKKAKQKMNYANN